MTADRAGVLRALHVPGRPLLLPNAWDAASARLVAEAGFPAVATSSIAVAQSLGYPDHHGAPPEEMFAAAARIVRAVEVPVTIDAEGGYGLPAAEFAERLLATGAVGCNLEDTAHGAGGLIPVAQQTDYLAAVRAAAGDRLVINARVDVYLHDLPEPLDAAIERATAYLAAGADCIYPILLKSLPDLRAIVAAVAPAAVNAMYVPGSPAATDLAEAGVARISLAGGLWRLSQNAVRDAVTGIAAGTMPY